MTEYRTERGVFYLGNCMEGMATFPDKYFDIAIVDPPYGIGADKKNSDNNYKSYKSATFSKNYGKQKWDNEIPDSKYFYELFRISKNQIIWGANYYGLKGGMLYWNKNVTMPTYSDGELAYCSLINSIKSFTYTWHGMVQEDMKNKELRIHPTQKPVALYKWLVKNYVKRGQRILDTHVGSASSLIAYEDAGLEYVGYEKDVDYYKAAVQRIKDHKAQLTMFPAGIA